MRKTLYIIISVLMASVFMTACHSSEQNYREAYEKAVERRQTGIGSETYAKIEAERQRYTHLVNGDSVRLVYVNANVAIDSTATPHEYNIVVATFAQRINAKSYRDRLRDECGFTGSYILYGGPEKQYFVVLQGYDNISDAAALLHDIDDKVSIRILEPLPWILKKM